MSQQPGDRSLTWWPFVGAAIIAVLAVGGIILVGAGGQSQLGLKTDDNGALICPDTYLQHAVVGRTVPKAWVPVQPRGIDGSMTLVPDTKPQKVTICHYPAARTLARSSRQTLLGHKVVTSGQSAMTKALSKYPAAPTAHPACTEPGDNFLAGFVFATGAVWIAVPNDGCQPNTNGDFQSDAAIRTQIVSTYLTGKWS